MDIPFYKMHGAANDFIVIDDRQQTFPTHDQDWMAGLMKRNTGIGSEGVLLIQPAVDADFRMRFFNPDGGEVDMCGNGARCIARLAYELNIAPQTMRFETLAGPVGAEMLDESTVRLTMTPPTDWRIGKALSIEGKRWSYDFVNSGVPHVVVELEDLQQVDVPQLGAAFRYHEAFAPKGTNVNFIAIDAGQHVRLRTYERGVEAETPACGTGIVACGLIAGKKSRVQPPVHVHTAGGHELIVDYRLTDAGAENVTLTGPTAHVFRGSVQFGG